MFNKYTLVKFIGCLSLFISTIAFAGNPDRAGQAGASELLVNPWGRSSGFHGMNTATTQGIEAARLNVGGLAFVNKTQFVLGHTMWLKGSGISVNSAGFAQKMGESSVLGLSLMSMSFGDIPVTTESDPEGLSGAVFSPQFLNIGVAYARSFSESIHVGFQLTLISEGMANVSATGAALDMGIQYVTGAKKNMHFGISLRNIGTPMSYGGDGLAYRVDSPNGFSLLLDQRSEKFELPSQLNIGAAYDFHLADKHRLTFMGNFTSNSFTKDFLGGGVEYAFNEMFMVRGGYRYEKGISSDLLTAERTTAFTGLSGGVSLEVPLKEDGPSFGVDYSFRATNPYAGTHTIGLRFNL
jgi:hypothetical protein